jgi:hypothetical protein
MYLKAAEFDCSEQKNSANTNFSSYLFQIKLLKLNYSN